jgi:hypothetical protein
VKFAFIAAKEVAFPVNASEAVRPTGALVSTESFALVVFA